jgi:hypothetical protein
MKIVEELVDESGILLTKDAVREGISKYAFYNYIAENKFEQVGHGIYASPEAWRMSCTFSHYDAHAE